MRFMASVNKLSLYVAIPIVILIYIAYFVYFNLGDDNASQQRIIDQHLENMDDQVLGGVVLGGSNAIYGVSASLLSEKTDLQFTNISLRSEGFNNYNYRAYVSGIFEDSYIQDAASIEVVIYSSIQYSRDSDRDNERSSYNIYGSSSHFQLIPARNLARFTLDNFISLYRGEGFALDGDQFYLIDDSGDLDHASVDCAYSGSGRSFENLGLSYSKIKVEEQASFLADTFSSALIYFVFPSEHFLDQQVMVEFFREVVDGVNVPESIIFLIDDTQLLQEHICDTEHHPNDEGRKMRTNFIIDNMVEQ